MIKLKDLFKKCFSNEPFELESVLIGNIISIEMYFKFFQ